MLDWDAESDCWNTRKSEVKSEEVGGCADREESSRPCQAESEESSRPKQAPRPRSPHERPPLKRRRRHTCDQGPQPQSNPQPKARPAHAATAIGARQATVQATAATAIGARQKTAIGARQKVVLRPNAALRFAQSRGGACPRLNANTAIGSRAPKLLHEKPLPKASQPRGSIAVTASGASPRPVAKPRPKAAQSRGTIAVTESERARPRGTMEVISV